jgi:hypothetical protein
MIPTISIQYSDSVFSPFSGQAADGDQGPNETDPTLLFVYYGDIGDYAYKSDAVEKLIEQLDENETGPDELVKHLHIANAFALEVDSGWNGVNVYGFAPDVALP